MNALLRLAGRFIIKFFATLLAAVVGIAALVWLMVRNEQGNAYLAEHGGADQLLRASGRVSRISNAELESILRQVYRVKSVRWIQPDLIWVKLPPEAEIQATCQGIANVWAHRSGLDYVRVESWSGNVRLGQGTVYGGRMVTPQSTRPAPPAPDVLATAEREIALHQERLAMMGKLFAEIEGAHGPPSSKDASTGWASWPRFRARFVDGRVVETAPQ